MLMVQHQNITMLTADFIMKNAVTEQSFISSMIVTVILQVLIITVLTIILQQTNAVMLLRFIIAQANVLQNMNMMLGVRLLRLQMRMMLKSLTKHILHTSTHFVIVVITTI